MTTPSFTTPPTAPNRNQGETTFNTNMAAFLSWLVTWAGEVVTGVAWMVEQVTAVAASAASALASAASAEAARAAAVAITTYVRESTASLAIGTGAKSVTGMASGHGFTNGAQVTLIDRTNPGNRMRGTVSAVASTSMTVTVGAGDFLGSGTPNDWLVVLTALEQLYTATAAQLLAASSAYAAITPAGIKAALAAYALTDGATVTPDNSLGRDFTWTIGGNRTLGAIINTHPGASGEIEITQDGTGSRILAWASCYKAKGGLVTLPTAAGAKAYLRYRVKTVDGSNVATLVIVTLVKAPSN